jgi:hypothetical protein
LGSLSGAFAPAHTHGTTARHVASTLCDIRMVNRMLPSTEVSPSIA